MNVKISGIGSFIPSNIQMNENFSEHEFLNDDGSKFEQPNDVIIEKFKAITGIRERRYANTNHNTSDLAFLAAKQAIEDAKIDPETIDQIIVAHNFGDVKHNTIQSDMVPSIAARVKHFLEIQNPACVAYDLIFGCPGWLQGVIHANAFIQSGMAKRCLVIGAETLSRVTDKHDRDSMIFSDGAGATILEATEDNHGILSFEAATYSKNEAQYLGFGASYNQNSCQDTRYIKMNGRKIYEFACTRVPHAMKTCLDKSNVDISDLKKIFIHQANEKMDEAIIKRFYKLYKMQAPEGIMPMCIQKLGNSSVATIPTLLDMVKRGEIKDQNIEKGDIIMFASVGAGMNINAVTYKV
ncbi:3-oxoacyl-[acyl-carrier-protein] synthase-3 [Pustulibacterium marinum]|uniref:3-oxoacyl-[acyl-carrier-protein] synthase-3 n=1 Tax=Pustulibacterium marinum TaxID=1224947 RepID=A0A1I7F5A9_9FLAO|nr:3-oxoacyl-ACP synthase III family protein [Pustulibacterium marinum]SFU31305.1 3-oxoacyl-[acyl-carrier-protein] synthase-3 [Pustulibacterium marinum]